MANATSVERKILEKSGCPVRAVLEHIVMYLGELSSTITSSKATNADGLPRMRLLP